MKYMNKNNGKVVSIIGTLWCFLALCVSCIQPNINVNDMFFPTLSIYSIPGTILLLIAISEFDYMDKHNISMSSNRKKLNNFNIITIVFVNIPTFAIGLYKIIDLSKESEIDVFIKGIALLVFLIIVIIKFINIVKDD